MEFRQLFVIGRLVILCVTLCMWSLFTRADSALPPETFEIPEGAFQAEFVENRNHITVMRFTGNYDRNDENGQFNYAPRAIIAREFYRTHPDNYDFLVVFTDFDIVTGDAVAFYGPTKNDVQGIGQRQFDVTARYGSAGKLRGVIDMAAVSRYVDKNLEPDMPRVLSVLAHETLHNSASYVRFDDNGQISDALIGKDDAHWSFFLDTGASVQYGHRWLDAGNGSFQAIDARRYYSPLDLYLMGFYSAAEIPDFFLVEPTDSTYEKTDISRIGARVSGSRKNISIEDIIAVEGPRIPDVSRSQKEFRYAFIYLTRPDTEISSRVINELDEIRRAYAQYFSIMTGGRGIAHIYPEAMTATELGMVDPVAPVDGDVFRTDGLQVDEGLTWLRSRQNGGVWADKPETAQRDTALVLQTLMELDSRFDNQQSALDWLSEQTIVNNDSMSRFLGVVNDSQLRDSLAARQNKDGGWGLHAGLASDTIDTALALRALQLRGASPAVLSKGVAYLLLQQNVDHGWPSTIKGRSTPMATAMVLQTLHTAGADDVVIQNGIAWLVSQQNGSDGGFGVEQSTVHDTALVLKTLQGVNQLGLINSTMALQYIMGRQRLSGSWENSVYTTALALSALQTVNLTNALIQDIIVDDVDIVEGERIGIKVMVSNDSIQNAPQNAFQVSLYDGDPSVSGVQIASSRIIESLPAKSSVISTFYWETLGKPGDHALHAVVDVVDVVAGPAERSQQDNSQYRPVTVKPAPSGVDLSVAADELMVSPATVNLLPSMITLSAVVRNIGAANADDVIASVFEVQNGNIVDPALAQQTFSILGLSSVGVNLAFELNKSGTTELQLLVDSAKTFVETDESNNVVNTSVVTQDSHDLGLTSSDITVSPMSPVLHEDSTFHVTVHNYGTLPTPNITVRYSVDNGTSTTEIQSNQILLAAGESKTYDVIWRVEHLGTARLVVELDPENTLPEFDESNNNVSFSFASQTLLGRNVSVSYRDLTFSPDPAFEGQGNTLSALLINSGTEDLSGVRVIFHDGDPKNGGHQIGDDIVVPLITAGEQIPVNVTWPEIAGDSDRTIYVTVDPQIPDELNRNDNQAFKKLVVNSLPDLAISSGGVVIDPLYPKREDTISVKATINNLGKQDANNVLVRIYKGQPAQGGLLLGTEAVNLAGLGSVQVETAFTVSSVGQDEIVVWVDPDDVIRETNAGNNMAARSFAVQDGDFYVTERFISPDNNGVKDATAYYYRLDAAEVVSVVVLNKQNQEVRTLLIRSADTQTGQALWDGKNDQGSLVGDGDYRIALKHADGGYSGDTLVTVDTNRSSLADALGTKYGLTQNLTCRIGKIRELASGLVRSPDDSYLYFVTHFVPVTLPDGTVKTTDEYTLHPSGLYRSLNDGSQVVQLVANDVIPSDSIVEIAVSENGAQLAVLTATRRYNPDRSIYEWVHTIWALNSDGSNLFQVYETVTDLSSVRQLQFIQQGAQLLFAHVGDSSVGNPYLVGIDKVDVVESSIPARIASLDLSALRRKVNYSAITMQLNAKRDRALLVVRHNTQFYSFEHAVEEEKNYLYLLDVSSGNLQLIGDRVKGAWAPDGQRFAVGDVTSGNIFLYDHNAEVQQEYAFPDQVYDQSVYDGYGVGVFGRFSEIAWKPDSSAFVFAFEDYMRAKVSNNFVWDSDPEAYYAVGDETFTDLGGLYQVNLSDSSMKQFARFAPLPLIVSEDMSSFHIYTWESGQWVKREELHFNLHYDTKTLPLDKYLPDGQGDYKIRISQVGHEEAQIEKTFLIEDGFKQLSPISAHDVDNGQDILSLVVDNDHRVASVLAKTIEVRWDKSMVHNREDLALGLIAREASPSKLPVSQFVYPNRQQFYSAVIDGRSSFTLDGYVDESDKRGDALFSTVSKPDSGHPAGTVAGYLGSDDEYLYAAIDFTPDNTADGKNDWASIEVHTDHGWKTFSVTQTDKTYGRFGFIKTNLAEYEHKYYEFKIPLNEIGKSVGQSVNLRFSAYGSAGQFAISNFASNAYGFPVTNDGLPYIEWETFYHWNQISQQFRLVDWLQGNSVLISGGHFDSFIDPIIVGLDNTLPTRYVFGDRLISGPTNGVTVSNTGRYLSFFSSDTLDACAANNAPNGYRQFQSLLNQVVDLRAVRSAKLGGVLLQGTASDKNFGSYQLEYAYTDSPQAWYAIAPGSEAMVIDDQFTTWVPPEPDNYFVRLSSYDLAGNSRQAIKRVTYSDTPSITNVYRHPAAFSPNGDGMLDVMTLHFKVLEAVNLEVLIYNDAGQLVRSIEGSYDLPGAFERIVWNGRDERGLRVSDGHYKVKVQRFEYSVDVDGTPPGISNETEPLLKSITKGFQPCDPEGEEQCYVGLDRAIKFTATDNEAIDDLYLEVSADDGSTDRVELPLDDSSGVVEGSGVRTISQLASESYRLIATDQAGNETVVAIADNLKREQAYLTGLGNLFSHGEVDDPSLPKFEENGETLYHALQPGLIQLHVTETIAQPIQAVDLLYKKDNESTYTALPVDRYIAIRPCAIINPELAQLRKKCVEELGNDISARRDHSFLFVFDSLAPGFDLSSIHEVRVQLTSDAASGSKVYQTNGFKLGGLGPELNKKIEFVSADLSIGSGYSQDPSDKVLRSDVSRKVDAAIRLPSDKVESISFYVRSNQDLRYKTSRKVETLLSTQRNSVWDNKRHKTIYWLNADDLQDCTPYTAQAVFVTDTGDEIATNWVDIESTCLDLETVFHPRVVEQCGDVPEGIIDIVMLPRRLPETPHLSLSMLSLEIPATLDGEDNEIVFNANAPVYGRSYQYALDTRDLEPGEFALIARLTALNGDEITHQLRIPIVKSPPNIDLKSPITGQHYCASRFITLAENPQEFSGFIIDGVVRSEGMSAYEVQLAEASADAGDRFACAGESSYKAITDSACEDSDSKKGLRLQDGAMISRLAPRINPMTGTSRANGTLGLAAMEHSGDYQVRGIAYNWSGARACQDVAFSIDADIDELSIGFSGYGVDDTSKLISPNGDGVFDTLAIALDVHEAVTLSVDVYRAERRSVKPLIYQDDELVDAVMNQAISAGSHAFEWTGLDSGGSVVADGFYKITVTAVDGCGNQDVTSMYVEVDTTAPVAAITYPDRDDPVAMVVQPVGSVTDLHLDTYQLSFSAGAGEFVVIPQGSGHENKINSALGVWNTFGLEGFQTLRLAASDKAGNQTVVDVGMELPARTNLISDLSLTFDYLSPNGDARHDEAVLRVKFEESVLTTVEVLNGENPIDTVANNETRTAGYHTFKWDGLDALSVPAGDGVYRLRVTARSVDTTLLQQVEELSVALDNTAPLLVLDDWQSGRINLNGNKTLTGQISDEHFEQFSLTVISTPDSDVPFTYFTSEQPSSGVIALLEGDAFAQEGDYRVQLVAQDKAGNISELDTLLTADFVPPQITLTSPVSDFVASVERGVLTVSGQIVDGNLAEYSVTLSPVSQPDNVSVVAQGATVVGGAFASIDVATIVDGDYWLSVRARDIADHVTVERVRIAVDNTAPTAAISTPVSNGYVNDSIAIIGTGADAHFSHYVIELANGTDEAVAVFDPLVLTPTQVQSGRLLQWDSLPDDGEYTLRLTATDEAQNKTVISQHIIVDTVPPAAPVLTVASVNGLSVELEWEGVGDIDLAGYLIYRNGQSVSTLATAETVYSDPDLPEGSYHYAVVAVDHAGLISEQSNKQSLVVDITPPRVALSAPSTADIVSGLIDIEGTAFSESDFGEYRLLVGEQNGPLTAIVSSSVPIQSGELGQWNTLGLSEGSRYTVRLEADDVKGNQSVAEVNITVDNTPPAAPSNLQGVLTANNVSLSWNNVADTDLAGYLAFRNDRLANSSGPVVGDLQPYLIGTTHYDDLNLVDGTFSFTVYAVDQAGNVSEPSLSFETTIDISVPHAEIVSVENGQQFESGLYLDAQVTDEDVAGVLFEYRESGTQDWLAIASQDLTRPFVLQWDTATLAYKNYEIRAVASDAHNTDSAPTIVSIQKVDLTRPAMVSNAQLRVNGGEVTLFWDASMESDLAGYLVRRFDLQNNTSLTLTNLPITGNVFADNVDIDGAYTYEVIAIDLAGNQSDASSALSAVVFTANVATPMTPTLASSISLQGTTERGASVTLGLVNGSETSAYGPVVADNDRGQFNFEGVWLSQGINTVTVTAVHPDGFVSRSVTMSIHHAVAPSQSTGVIASMNVSDEVEVKWNSNPVEDAVLGYRIYRNGESVSPGEIVTRSSAFSDDPVFGNYSDRQPSMIIDGNVSTYWSPQEALSSVGVELAQTSWVTGITLEWSHVEYRAVDYDVQAWDGEKFVTVTSVKNQATKNQIIGFETPYRTQKLRIAIVKAYHGMGYYVRLAEFNVSALQLSNDLDYFTEIPSADGYYNYAVSAVNSVGFEGPLSDSSQVGFGDVSAPAAVVLNVPVVSSASVSLLWSESSSIDIAAYRVYRDSMLIAELTHPTLSYSDARLLNGQYSYSVSAIDAVGNESVMSNSHTADVSVALLSAPVSVVAVSQPEGSIQLNWDAAPNSDPGSYRLYRSMQSGSNFEQLTKYVSGGLSVSNSWTDTNVVSGNTYYYHVLAVDLIGNASLPSQEAVATASDVLAPLPPVIAAPLSKGEAVLVAHPAVSLYGFAEPANHVYLMQNGEIVNETSALSELSVTAADGYIERVFQSHDGRIAAIIKDDSYEYYGDLYVYDRQEWRRVWNYQGDGSGIYDATWIDEKILLNIAGDDRRMVLLEPDDGSNVDVTEQISPVAEPNSFIGYDRRSGHLYYVGYNQTSGWGLYRLHMSSWQSYRFDSISSYNNYRAAVLSPDGRYLLATKRNVTSSNGKAGLLLLDLESGVEQQLTEVNAGYGYAYLSAGAWSADGTRVVLSIDSVVNGRRKVLGYDVATAAEILNLEDTVTNGHYSAPFWHADNESVILGWTDYSNKSGILRYDMNSKKIASLYESDRVSDFKLLCVCAQQRVIFKTDATQYLTLSLPGAFAFEGAPLNAQESLFTAFAVDDNGNMSPDSQTLAVNFIAQEAKADLTVELAVSPQLTQLGNDVMVTATLGNIGTDVSDTTELRMVVYGPNNSEQILIPQTPVGPLAPDATVTFDASLTALHVGSYAVVVTVDADNKVEELSESNNTAIVEIVAVEQAAPQIKLNVVPGNNDFIFKANEAIKGSVEVTNAGDEFSGQLHIVVEDSAGYLVVQIISSSINALRYSDDWFREFDWNTAQTYAGRYRIKATLVRDGLVIAEESADFNIVEDVQVVAGIAANKFSYHSTDIAQLTMNVANRKGNAVLRNATINLFIKDATQQVVHTGSSQLTELLPGDAVTVVNNWMLGDLLPGRYTVDMFVSKDEMLLTSASTQFEILASEPGFVGLINGYESYFVKGEPIEVRYRLTNSANVVANEVEVTFDVIQLPDNQVVDSHADIVSLGVNESITGNVSFASNSLRLGAHRLIMRTLVTRNNNEYRDEHHSVLFNVGDGQPPAVSIISPAAGSVINGVSTFGAIKASDTDSVVTSVGYQLDGGSWITSTQNLHSGSGTSYRVNLSELLDGAHNLTVNATDSVGNISDDTTVYFVVDNTPPAITIDGVLDGKYYDKSVSPQISISDLHFKSAQLLLNGDSFTSGSTVDADGVYLLQIRAEDAVGNINTKMLSFVIDTTSPMIAISGVVDGGSYNHSVIPDIRFTDENAMSASMTVMLNGQSYVPGTAIENEGMHILSVSIQDTAGNLGVKTIEFTIDYTKPLPPVVSSPSNGSTVSSNVLSVSGVSEPGIVVSVSNDTSEWTAIADWNGDFVVGNVQLDSGSNSFQVSAIDLAGNVSDPANLTVNHGSEMSVLRASPKQRVLLYLPPQSTFRHPGCMLNNHDNHDPNWQFYDYDIEALYHLLDATMTDENIAYTVVRSDLELMLALREGAFNTIVIGQIGFPGEIWWNVSTEMAIDIRAHVAMGAGLVLIKNTLDSAFADIFNTQQAGNISAERVDAEFYSGITSIHAELLEGSSIVFSPENQTATHGRLQFPCSLDAPEIKCYSTAYAIDKYGDGDVAFIPFNPAAFSDADGMKQFLGDIIAYVAPDAPAILPDTTWSMNWHLETTGTPATFTFTTILEELLTFTHVSGGDLNDNRHAKWVAVLAAGESVDLAAWVKLPNVVGEYSVDSTLYNGSEAVGIPVSELSENVSINKSLSEIEADTLSYIDALLVPSELEAFKSLAITAIQSAIGATSNEQIYQMHVALYNLQVVRDETALYKASRMLKIYHRHWFEGAVPAQPQNVSASVKNGLVTVVWNAVNLATRYRVFRRTSLQSEFIEAEVLPSTEFGDVLTDGVTRLEYYVVAENDVGVSEPSVIASVTYDPSVLVDTDGDGIDDNYELTNGLNPSSGNDAGLDSDGDSINNLDEYLAGTEIHNASSYPFSFVVDNTDSGVSYRGSWMRLTGGQLYWGSDWTVHRANPGSTAIADAATWRLTIPGTDTYRIYGRWVQGKSDLATDARYHINHLNEYGRPASTEVVVNQAVNGGQWVSLGEFTLSQGTHNLHLSAQANGKVVVDAIRLVALNKGAAPLLADTNSDGVADLWASLNGVIDANADNDQDGLTNLQEYRQGTQPKDADTDNDGRLDGYEVSNNLDPLYPDDVYFDADGDGVIDLDEMLAGTDPLDSNHKPVMLVFDDEDSSFTQTGIWTTTKYYGGFYGSSTRYHQSGTGSSDHAQWTINLTRESLFNVYARWVVKSSNASNAQYTVTHLNQFGQPAATTITLDQSRQGGEWVLLGNFRMPTGISTVILSDTTDVNGKFFADSIKILETNVVGN